MSLPQHQNPTEPDRTASAPYNFVPLPERVVKAVKQAKCLPSHDAYKGKSGYFQVTLTAKSPLYVRCPFPLEDFLRQERREDEKCPFQKKVRNTPDFFYTHDKNQPVIPGSSLRGMLRSLLEVVSYGKVERVTDKRLFFRTLDMTALGTYYKKRLVEGGGKKNDGYRSKTEGGFWRVCSDGAHRIETCTVARVEMRDVANAFGLQDPACLYVGRGPNAYPNWKYQHRKVWVRLEKSVKDHSHSNGTYLRYRKVKSIKSSCTPAHVEATLVLTGPMPRKHLAFVFVGKSPPDFVDVPNDQEEGDINKRLVDLFHDDDQITRWQATAFPEGKPAKAKRTRDGRLRDGEPVFFLQENGELMFFGRAQMFRLPYRNRPLDLIPEKLRRPEDVDYADALFGFVRSRKDLDDMKNRGVCVPKQGEKGRAYASRVFVSDARLTPEQNGNDLWLSSNAITPRILATPKPTAFQHYLTQQKPDKKNELNHYDSPSTTLRGHKRYWHQGDREVGHVQENEKVKDDDSQHTRFMPVKAGVKFTFRVYFENLSERELGALCWVLHPLGDSQKTYCQSLGMGKPLGMGAVELDAKLHLTDRPKRYAVLFHEDNWETGVAEGRQLSDRKALKSLTKAFEQHILDEFGPVPCCPHLFGLKRVGMLLKMMEWPGFPPVMPPGVDNRYLEEEKRPNTRYMSIGLPTEDGKKKNEYRDRPVLPDPSAFEGCTGKHEPGVKAGDRVKAELLPEKTKNGGWKAQHRESGLGGPIQDNENAPPDARPGQTVELTVASVNEREMAFRWASPSAGNKAGPKRKPDRRRR